MLLSKINFNNKLNNKDFTYKYNLPIDKLGNAIKDNIKINKDNNFLRKIDKKFADNLKARLSLTDLIDPFSRVTYIFESGKFSSYFSEFLKMLSSRKIEPKFFTNIISDTNIPSVGTFSYFIKSLGVFIGAFKGVVNGIAEINAGINTNDKSYKYLGIVDLIGALGGIGLILGMPLVGIIMSSILIPIKGYLIFKNSSKFSDIQKGDYIFSSISTILNYSLYFNSILPYTLPVMPIVNALQLIFMNNSKFREFLINLVKKLNNLLK